MLAHKDFNRNEERKCGYDEEEFIEEDNFLNTMWDDAAAYKLKVESSDLSGFSSSPDEDDESDLDLSDDEIIFNKKAGSNYAKMTREERAKILA